MAKSSPGVAIAVALIGLVGAIGTALISNWDKVSGASQPPTPTRDAPPPTREAPPPTRDAPPPARAEPTPARVEAPSAAEPTLNLGGTWRDTTPPGGISQVTQDGESFRFTRSGTLPTG